MKGARPRTWSAWMWEMRTVSIAEGFLNSKASNCR